ncbi:MAG: hypothetical protein ACREID_09295 [Planctomycetota bacterium]
MTVVFGCPRCGKGIEGAPGDAARCPRCGEETRVPAAPERLSACLVCAGELYRHRDFNPKLGLVLVALGAGAALASSSFLPLAAAAAVDLLLYLSLPDVAICYACKAHHRGFAGLPQLPRFDLERHEHHRFRKARAEGKIPPPR